MQLAELIMSAARDRGLKHFFGLPGGGAPLDMIEFGRRLGVDFVSVAHESSSAIMAAYYGQMLGAAGLSLAIKGVGAGNLAGGAVNAHFERVPVVCCCESAPTTLRGQELVSLCAHERLFGAVSKYNATLAPELAAQQIEEAFVTAIDGRPGPVLLDLPSELGEAECSAEVVQEPPAASLAPPDEVDLAKIRVLIESSRRPLILAGADVIRGGATKELLAFAEGIEAAVVVNMDAHGVFPESHPRYAGPFIGHFLPNTIESEFIKQADLGLLIGCDSVASDNPWNLSLTTCEIVARAEYPSFAVDPRVRVNGDIAATLKSLSSMPNQSGFSETDIRASREKILRNFRRPPDAQLAAQDIIEISRRLFPTDGILISETGIFILMLQHLWPFDEPSKHFCSAGGRTMGLAVPALIGAKLAKPEHPMMGIGADGSLLMRLGELEVMARTGIAAPLVIINDSALGTMKWRQKARRMPDHALDLQTVDFCRVALAVGMRGVMVETPEQFEKELKIAMIADRATLIDARVDSQAYQDSFGPTVGVLE